MSHGVIRSDLVPLRFKDSIEHIGFSGTALDEGTPARHN